MLTNRCSRTANKVICRIKFSEQKYVDIVIINYSDRNIFSHLYLLQVCKHWCKLPPKSTESYYNSKPPTSAISVFPITGDQGPY